MRDLMAKARLEYGQALWDPYGAAIAVGQADHAAAALVERTRSPCQENERDQAKIEDQEIIRELLQRGLLGRRAHDGLRQIGSSPFGAGAFGNNGPTGLVEAKHSQRRHQYSCGKQKRRCAFEKRLHPQPEIKADAAMDPGDDQNQKCHPHSVGPHDQISMKHLRIEFCLSEQRMAEPDADHVGDDQRRDAQA
jgi:hypothetical protein